MLVRVIILGNVMCCCRDGFSCIEDNLIIFLMYKKFLYCLKVIV